MSESSCVSKLLNQQITQCLPERRPSVRFIELIFLYFNFLVLENNNTYLITFVKIKEDTTWPSSYYNCPVTQRSSHGSSYKPKHINTCDIKLTFPWLVFKLFNESIKSSIQKAGDMWREWKWTWVNSVCVKRCNFISLIKCMPLYTSASDLSLKNKVIKGRNIFYQSAVHQWA